MLSKTMNIMVKEDTIFVLELWWKANSKIVRLFMERLYIIIKISMKETFLIMNFMEMENLYDLMDAFIKANFILEKNKDMVNILFVIKISISDNF